MSSKLCLILILYLKILNVTCKGNSSLTFVIDDTNSMANDIAEVIRGSRDLLDFVLNTKSSEIEDLILVTFNDPDVEVRAKTKSKTEFIRALECISVYGGGDCPEYALKGIIESLEKSKSNSYLYVFTDASAADFHRMDEVINLCEQKQSQVIFVLTGKCPLSFSNIKGYNVYYEIAKACSGSIITVDNHEVHLAVDAIKHIVDDKKTIVSMITVQQSFFPTRISFTLDEKIEHAIITVSGSNVEFNIRKSNNFYEPILPTETLMSTSNFKVVKLVNTNPGSYTAWVKGNSEVSIVVYGKTDLTFEYGFSDFVPKSMADTSKQPVTGKEHYLSISVRDPEHEVNIKTAAILSADEKVLKELSLRKIGTDFYVTEPLLPPETTFKVAVKGIIIKTGKPIVRISKISVQPRLPDVKTPSLTIKEGSKIKVNYDSNVSLNCEVSAYPKPKIHWHASDRNLFESISSMIEFPYKYINNLKVNHIKRAKSYICEASNNLGTTRNSIQINVVSPLKWIVTLPAVTRATYGKELKLKCLVHSSYATETKWYFTGPRSNDFTLSANGSELTIKEMEINLEGQYTCKVFLKDDPETAEIQTTQVKIVDLARIRFDVEQITVPEKSKTIISCRIVKGTPRPKISWQYRKNEGSELISLYETSEDLTINDVSLNQTGKYVCTATNVFGSAKTVIELEVSKSPEILKDGGSDAHVPYDGRYAFTCRVVAHPPPTILWKDELGNIVYPTNKISANEHEFTSRLDLQHIRKNGTYSCFAENSVGKSDLQFEVFVKPPFTYDSKLNVLKVKYGEKINLKCDIMSSHYPFERNWFVNRSKEFIKSNDKYILTPDGSELVINSMDINLQGTYVCRVNLQADPNIYVEKNTLLTIYDLAPPKLASSQKIVNQTFIARCVIKEGIPRPFVTWKFKGDSGNIKDLKIEGETLIINNIQPQHNGLYQCIGNNPIGSDKAILSLEIKESPKIVTDKTEYSGVVGDKVLVIPCIVTGYPDPTIVWKNSNNEIIKTGSKYIIKGSSNKLSLYILNPLESDTGKLICEARNNVGTTTKTFDVLVETNVSGNLEDKHNIYLLENESKDINCTLLYSNSYPLIWYKNGYLTDVTGTTYSIQKATVSDDGNYTCRVNTEVGSVSETFVVDVGYPPMFEDDETLISWLGNEETVVDCSVRAKPAATVEWLVNGERINTKKFEHHIHGWGKYKCKVSNVHGVIEKTVTVTTLGCLINRTMEKINNPPLISNTNINIDYDEGILNYNKYMFIDQGQQMQLTCYQAGENTFNLFPEKDTIIAECDREDKFISEDKTYNFSDLKCKKLLIPTLKPTEQSCFNTNSKLIEVGFEVPNFVDIYEICYDNKLNIPNFAYSKLLKHNLGNQERRWIGQFPYDAGKGIDYCDEESKCCYGKGQLVNAADVDIGPPQITPFVDLNAISVWKPCEKENRITWRKLEEAVRSMLLSYNTIQVWSGASSYDDQRIPRYLWKVLKANEEIIAVVVYVNTPEPKNEDIKCKKPEQTLVNLGLGDDPFTYLCSLEDFSKAFTVPMDTFSRDVY